MNTFTINDLMLYALNELETSQLAHIENEIRNNVVFQQELLSIQKSVTLLNELEFSPNDKCIDMIIQTTCKQNKLLNF
jgi:L-2-hydroxyglutarate oxidase LhgO